KPPPCRKVRDKGGADGLSIILFQNFHPAVLAGALGNGFAEAHFVVASFECRKKTWLGKISCLDVGVEILKELDERIGISFSMASRVGGITSGFGSHDRGVFDDFAVRFSAAADPKRVGLL